jgi:hypothetical protein
MRSGGRGFVIRIKLSQPMMDELYRAAQEASHGRDCGEDGGPITPEDFATECVESILASRRLEAMTAIGMAPGARRAAMSA